jgi:hypothetical protein
MDNCRENYDLAGNRRRPLWSDLFVKWDYYGKAVFCVPLESLPLCSLVVLPVLSDHVTALLSTFTCVGVRLME